MARDRLKYEIARLGQTYSAGLTSSFLGLVETGTTVDGAKWYDITDFIDKPDDVVFSFGTSSKDQLDQLDSTGIDKGISSNLDIFSTGYSYVRHWLIDHENASINSFIVRITDVLCNDGGGKSLGSWEMKADNLKWCNDGICNIATSLDEYTPVGNCLKQTLIADNHRGWFPDEGVLPDNDALTGDPLPDFIHPVFRYCIDIKPQALQNFIFVIAQSITLIVNSVVGVIVAIDGLLGGDLQEEVEEWYGDIFENLIGCNRKHPSPFVRNYFINGCSKCGIEFQSNIFNDPGGQYGRYYNTAMLFAPSRNGLKEEEVDTDKRDWLPSNKPNESVLSFAYMLKNIFNAKFKLENGKFIFSTRNSFPETIVFDFTGADKALILEGICYGWNAEKKPASITFEYGHDAVDIAGDEALSRFNGNKDWATNNPFYNGIKEVKAEFFSTPRFTTDGIDRELPFANLENQPFWEDGIMIIEKGMTSLGKLLIWDGVSEMNEAKVIKVHVTTEYVLQWPDEWIWLQTGLTLDYWVYNYPMMFDWYTNENVAPGGGTLAPEQVHANLFELHKIDDPTQSGLQNKSWSVVLELCCPTLNRLIEVDESEDGVFCHLDYLVQLSANEKGNIRKVEVDYNRSEIRLSGDIKYTV